MFGLFQKKKPLIHQHWYVPLMDFQSDPEAFYQAIEAEMKSRRLPEAVVERITFREGGPLTDNRTYLRIRREGLVVDLASAPFGTSWYFSMRSATLPRVLYWWEIWLALLALAGLWGLYWHLYGLTVGAIVLGSSLAFLLLIGFIARRWGGLDEYLTYLPVIGALYEAFLRKDTYHRQDARLIYSDLLGTIIRGHVIAFCTAGGIPEPKFQQVSNPEQIMTARELAF
jgi:hypothetical protein